LVVVVGNEEHWRRVFVENGKWIRIDLDGNPVLPLLKERA
jgi:hypothetical protein